MPAPSFTPTDRDRQIFRLVKFHGQRQSQVARDHNISQATVSRIVQRYERWLAHGGPAQDGAPTHEERLRSQLWLTYERNEHIIASALRLAGEMEQSLDASKSTVSHPLADYTKETSVRTEHKVIDRSGIAARFLRLAHRINMDQLALVQRLELPILPPLTAADADIPADEPFCQPIPAPEPFDPSTAPNYTPCMDLDPDAPPHNPTRQQGEASPNAASHNPTRQRGETSPNSASSSPTRQRTETSVNHLNIDSPSDSPLTPCPATTYNGSSNPKNPTPSRFTMANQT